jgi:hypothetical protein
MAIGNWWTLVDTCVIETVYVLENRARQPGPRIDDPQRLPPKLPCPDSDCTGGGFRLLDAVVDMAQNRRNTALFNLPCAGMRRRGPRPCGVTMEASVSITYK